MTPNFYGVSLNGSIRINPNGFYAPTLGAKDPQIPFLPLGNDAPIVTPGVFAKYDFVGRANGVSATITSNTLSVSAGDFIVVVFTLQDGNLATDGFVSNDGDAISWSFVLATAVGPCQQVMFTGTAGAIPPTTVSMTATAGTDLLCAKTLFVGAYTNAHATNPLPAGNIFSGTSGTDVSQSITPTSSGSALQMIVGDSTSSNTFAPITNNTFIGAYDDAVMTVAAIRPTLQPRPTNSAFTLGETDTSGSVTWIAFEVQAAVVNATVAVNNGQINLTANDVSIAATSNATVAVDQGFINLIAQSITATGTSPSATVAVNQAQLSLTANDISVSSTSNATIAVDQGAINLAGQSVTAIGSSPITVAVNQSQISLTANDVSVSFSSNATVSVDQGSINLVGQSVTATSSNPDVTVSVNQAQVSLTANDVSVAVTSNVTISVNQGVIDLVSQSVTATASNPNVTVAVDQGVINLVGQSVTAILTNPNMPGGGVSFYRKSYSPKDIRESVEKQRNPRPKLTLKKPKEQEKQLDEQQTEQEQKNAVIRYKNIRSIDRYEKHYEQMLMAYLERVEADIEEQEIIRIIAELL